MSYIPTQKSRFRPSHHVRTSSLQIPDELNRHEEACRAAQIMLGSSSLASSMDSSLHSQQSQTSSLPSYGAVMNQHQQQLQQQEHHHQQFPQQFQDQQVWDQAGYSCYTSYNVPPATQPTGMQIVMTEDLVSGTSHNGHMSPVRRFFILLCLFDLLFITLLWVIAILVSGRPLAAEMKHQVLEYTIHSSMFDCVFTGLFRFLVSFSFYCLLEASHWLPIATNTTVTVIFLGVKVFQYQWTTGDPIMYDVMLILLTFILSWGQVWFFDFRLVPLERKAKEIWRNQEDERRPLLARTSRRTQASSIYYSPVGSPEHSDCEFDDEDRDSINIDGVRVPRTSFRNSKRQPFSSQEKEYIKKGESALSTSLRLINSENWKLEKQSAFGDTVHFMWNSEGRKLFKLAGQLNISASKLIKMLHYNFRDLPKWNPTVMKTDLIQKIDYNTDVSYQVCCEAAFGFVHHRDFVTLRRWSLLEPGVFVSAMVSVQHPAMPQVSRVVRASMGPGCFVARDLSTARGQESCKFEWFLDADLKGWIPRAISDRTLATVQLKYISRLRTYLEKGKSSNL